METIDKLTFNDLVETFFGNIQKNECKVNIENTEKSYNLYLQLPGYKKDEINIKIDNNLLTVNGDGKNDKKYTLNEFKKEKFENKFNLCDDIDTDNIDASMEDGILTIILNKKIIENKTKNININIK